MQLKFQDRNKKWYWVGTLKIVSFTSESCNKLLFVSSHLFDICSSPFKAVSVALSESNTVESEQLRHLKNPKKKKGFNRKIKELHNDNFAFQAGVEREVCLPDLEKTSLCSPVFHIHFMHLPRPNHFMIQDNNHINGLHLKYIEFSGSLSNGFRGLSVGFYSRNHFEAGVGVFTVKGSSGAKLQLTNCPSPKQAPYCPRFSQRGI